VKQDFYKSNLVSVLVELRNRLKLSITTQKILEIKRHPEYPSLSSISGFLSEVNIDNLAIRGTKDQLVEIPYPAIAHFKNNNGQFVLLTEFSNGMLSYFDPAKETSITEPVDEFEKKWTGTILLLETTAKSGEPDYNFKKRTEVFQNVSKAIIIILLATVVIVPFLFLSLKSLVIYLVKILGISVTYLLLNRQFGGANARVEAFCKMGDKADCDSVIQSPASKLFGIVHLSEIGFLYFAGGLLTIVLTSLTLPEFGVLFLLSIFSVPFVFFCYLLPSSDNQEVV
jgi:uncharacterized membrane protein